MSIKSILAKAAINNEVLRVSPGDTRTVDLMVSSIGSTPSSKITVYQLTSFEKTPVSFVVDAQGGGFTKLPTVRPIQVANRKMLELQPYMAAGAIQIVSPGIYYKVGQLVTAQGVTMQVDAVDNNGRVQVLSITNAPSAGAINADLQKPTGGTGRDLAIRLTYKLVSIATKTPGPVITDEIEIIGDGSGAKARMVLDYAIQPQHELVTTTLGVNDFTLIKDLPLAGDDVLLVKPSQDVAVRIIEKN